MSTATGTGALRATEVTQLGKNPTPLYSRTRRGWGVGGREGGETDPEVHVGNRKQIIATGPRSHRPLVAVLCAGRGPLCLGRPDGPQLAESGAEGG